jgi:CubicO group peptidase (beta-lactamase class C family)
MNPFGRFAAPANLKGVKTMVSGIEIRGNCAPEFAEVREAFIRNFVELGDVGADCALYVDGELAVDLYGGVRNSAGAPWMPETVVNVWSSTKGIAAAAFAMLVDRALASYENPVSRHWPEFGQAGKEAITIGQLLSHQAGLSGFKEPMTIEQLLSGEAAAKRLIAQAPFWEPGAFAGYHGQTMGVLTTALFERIEGRSLKKFVAEEIAKAHGLDLQIGLAPSDRERVAETIENDGLDPAMIGENDEIRFTALANPLTPSSLSNDPAWQAADFSAANGYANARSLARLYNLLIGAPANRKALVGAETLTEATKCRYEGIDRVKGDFHRWSAGFWLNHDNLYGPNLEAFGHSGWGGSFGFGDPVAKVAFSYTMNKMSNEFETNPRRRNPINALYACL